MGRNSFFSMVKFSFFIEKMATIKNNPKAMLLRA
jgi:hypothetical protein